MSWSYSYKGDARAAADHINDNFGRMSVTPEPEKTISRAVQAILLNALTNWNPEHGIEISAWGSQSTSTEGKGQTNDLSLRITQHKLEPKAE